MADLPEEVRREIGQHFVFGFHGYDVSDDIKKLITHYYLGNVILMKRNIRDIEQVHALVKSLQRLAKEAGHESPLMIGIDQENGLVSAFSTESCGTQFPGAMAVASVGSVDLAKEISHASGKEMKMAGINWVYSPVADVNSDPRNPVIGVRSFGDDPNEVAEYVNAVSTGLSLADVAPSAKHFPGHGNTHVDSHLSLPVIMRTKAEVDAVELVPFKKVVESGIATIMTGHMALPLVAGDDTPCSLSRKITTGLLREEMGFEGVIVTDCLEMEAVAEKYGSEGGAVMALQAGADVVMICHTMSRQQGAIEAAYAAVKAGRLSLDELRASGKRIAALKEKYTSAEDFDFDAPLDIKGWVDLKKRNIAFSKHAYSAVMSVLHNPPHGIPLRERGFVVVFTPRMERLNLAVDDAEGLLRTADGRLRNTAGPSYYAFAAAIAQRAPAQHIVYRPESELSHIEEEYLNSATEVIFALRNGFDKGAWQMECLKRVYERMENRRLVIVSTCAPYDVVGMKETFPRAALCATMEFTVPALEAMVQVLFGEAEATGTVPVHRSA